jgi:hypothetical protein
VFGFLGVLGLWRRGPIVVPTDHPIAASSWWRHVFGRFGPA